MASSGKYVAPPKANNVIRAHGEISTRIVIVVVVGVLLALLILGGFVIMWIHPDRAKDIWVITGPIVSAGITALAGALLIEKSKK
jgi:hypothetical protein